MTQTEEDIVKLLDGAPLAVYGIQYSGGYPMLVGELDAWIDDSGKATMQVKGWGQIKINDVYTLLRAESEDQNDA